MAVKVAAVQEGMSDRVEHTRLMLGEAIGGDEINGLPGLAELPILGALFKSNDYINQQTELMVLVTPYVVHAVAAKDLSRPDDGFADPSDPAQVLLGRFNRIYGVGGIPDPPDNYRGKYGFILD